MKTRLFGPFLGINNRLPDSALLVDAKTGECFLRAANNVDIDNANRLRRRNGRTLIQAMTGAHSWRETDATHGYLVRDSVLYSVDLTSGYSETLLKVLASNASMSYLEFNSDVYFSNGTDCGRISGSLVYPWAMATPSRPVLTAIAGTLHKGTYQVALTYANSVTGEEGGAGGVTSIDLAASNTGIRITLPGASSGATHIGVYVSENNGKAPYLHSMVAIGTATLDISASGTGRLLRSNFEEPMPAGTGLFMHMGRLCAKKGKVLYYGNPYRPGYCDPVGGFIPFETDISIAVPCQNGVYVAADKTRWIPGDLAAPSGDIADVLPYGAVPDSQFEVIGENKVGWFGENGIVLANPLGQAESVMDKAIDLDMPASGVSHVTLDRGFLHVVSCGWCLNVENLAVTTYSQFDFTSMSGSHGTMADGFYRLSGDKDGTADIDATASFGQRNFGSEELKRLPYAYLGVTSDEPMQLRVQWADRNNTMQDYTYPARSSGGNLAMQRVDLGRGIEASWFDVELHNQAGSDFTLASVSFTPTPSNRRI